MGLKHVDTEDCVSHHAWHGFKSLTQLWQCSIAICSDVSVNRQKAPGCQLRPVPANYHKHWTFYPDLTWKTGWALHRFGLLELPPKDHISKQTLTDHPFPFLPLLVYLPLFCLHPLCFPSTPLLCRPTIPALFSSFLPDQHYFVETTAPSVINEQRLMQSPTLRQTLSAHPSLTHQHHTHTQFQTHPKVSWGKRRCQRKEEESHPKRAHQHPSIPASISPYPSPRPYTPPLFTGLEKLGFTFCPGSQALRHR